MGKKRHYQPKLIVITHGAVAHLLSWSRGLGTWGTAIAMCRRGFAIEPQWGTRIRRDRKQIPRRTVSVKSFWDEVVDGMARIKASAECVIVVVRLCKGKIGRH